MVATDFIKLTIGKFDEDIFKTAKNFLIDNNLISFSFTEKNEITINALSEKISDYFEKFEIKHNKNFDKFLNDYCEDLNSVIENKIEKEQKHNKKNENDHIIPRAKRYYDKVQNIRKIKDKNQSSSDELTNLVDYSRIILCLYSSIISNMHNNINNFDFSAETLDISVILSELKNEKKQIINKVIGQKEKFDIKEPLNSDCFSLLILVIIYFYIKNNKMEDE